MRKILPILLCLVIVLGVTGCGKQNSTEADNTKPVISTNPNDTQAPSETEDAKDKTENNENEFFKHLDISIGDANENYIIEAKNENGIISGIIGRESSGDLVDMKMSSTDWGNKYDAHYDLARNVPNNSTIHIKPVVSLKPVESDFDIDWLNVRTFNTFLGDIYLKAGSNCFDEIVFNDKNNMELRGTVGDFVFQHYPDNKLIETDYYPGGYSCVRFYATTTENGNITFNYNEETKEFTIESDVDISMLTVRVINDKNQDVDTVNRDMVGKVIKFTINEKCKADMTIVEGE